MSVELPKNQSSRYLLIGVMALAGTGLIGWLNLTDGPGLTTDSYHYLAAANSLFETGTLRMKSGEPMIVWPPLFPFLLHFLRYIPGVPLVKSTGLFQAITFGGVITMTGLLLHRLIGKTTIIAGGLIATVLAAPLLFVHHFLYSEPLFILFLLLQIRLLTRYSIVPDWRNWLWVVLITALLPLQRYIGVALVPAAMFIIWQAHQDSRALTKWLRTLGCGLLALLPLLIWWLRNLSLTGSATGDRAVSKENLFGHAWKSLDVMSAWLMPLPIPLAVRISATALFLIGLGWALATQWKNKSLLVRKYASTICIVLIAYCGFLLATKSRMGEGLNERFLMPAYLPLLLLFCLTLDQMSERFPKTGRWLLLLFALWLAYPVARGVKNVRQWAVRATVKK